MQQQTQDLAYKIAALAPAKHTLAEHFIEELQARPDGDDVRFPSALSESSFANVWSNPEDDVYDAL